MSRLPSSRESESPCLLCGREPPFPVLFTRGEHSLVRCPDCGLVCQNPQPPAEELERTYYFDARFTAALEGPLAEVAASRAREKLPLVRSVTSGPGRLLDVGCSSGAWLEEASRAGWRGTGIEVGPDTAEAARGRGLDVRTGSLEEALPGLGGERFDLITFWDVLEHLREPTRELEMARRLLAPGGVVAATFPNVEGLYPRLTLRLTGRRGVWEFPELPVHLYDFGPETAARLFRASGLEPVRQRTSGVPFSHYMTTTLTPEALGGGARARVLRWGLWGLHLLAYPIARALGRGNQQFIAARAGRGAASAPPGLLASGR